MRIIFFISLLIINKASFANFDSNILSMLNTGQYKIASESKSGDDCLVKFIEIDNNRYVIKQIKSDSNDDNIKIIFEKVATDIGLSINAPIAQTVITNFSNKPSILQEFLPGDMSKDINIQQKSRSPYMAKILEKRYGKLDEVDMGLTLNVIHNMENNDSLIKLVAFDTFVNNADRSQANLLYSQDSNRYYGVDHISVFGNNSLAKHAKRQIKALIDNSEIRYDTSNALIKYKQYLEGFMKNYKPEQISGMIDEQFLEHFSNLKTDPEINDTLDSHKRFIRRNYIATQELIDYINDNVKV